MALKPAQSARNDKGWIEQYSVEKSARKNCQGQ